MKALITGSNGTIGNKLKRFLQFYGVEVYTWDRSKTSIFDYYAMEEYIQKLKPDVVYHLAIASTLNKLENETWKVNYEWPSELAWVCRIHQIKFIFTSSYEVFSDYNNGPFDSTSKPDAFEGFGFEKRMAEERVLYQNPHAIIIRLPLQISRDVKDNGLLNLIQKEISEKGEIHASTNYYPALAFIEDTVAEIYRISVEYDSGLFMVDSNAELNYYDILSRLKVIYQKDWVIEKSIDFTYNQSMIDEKVKIPKLSERLLEKETELHKKSEKRIAIVGNKDVIRLSQIYRNLGYKINLLYDDDLLAAKDLAEVAEIDNYSNDIDELLEVEQIIITTHKYTSLSFLEKIKDKIIILLRFPLINCEIQYAGFKNFFDENRVYLVYFFSQHITAKKIREAINTNKIGKINNIFLDIGSNDDNDFKDAFFQISLAPLSFLTLYFKKFILDYSDYNAENNLVFSHLCNGNQRLNINFYKLWYQGRKYDIRIIGDCGEIKVEGKYTKDNNWNFTPISINEDIVGQGEYSKDSETIQDLSLKDYIEILEKEIHKESYLEEVYTGKKAFELFAIFKNMWKHQCKDSQEL